MLDILLKAFREKRFDAGILETVEFARERFAAAKKQTRDKSDIPPPNS